MITTTCAYINKHVTTYGQDINWCIFSAHAMVWTDRTVDADAAAGAPDVSAASAATGALPFVVCEPNNTARQLLHSRPTAVLTQLHLLLRFCVCVSACMRVSFMHVRVPACACVHVCMCVVWCGVVWCGVVWCVVGHSHTCLCMCTQPLSHLPVHVPSQGLHPSMCKQPIHGLTPACASACVCAKPRPTP